MYSIISRINTFGCLDYSVRLLHTRSLNTYSWCSCVLKLCTAVFYFRAWCYIHFAPCRINEALISA